MLNTNICTATSLLTWTFLDYFYYKKPAILGSVQGMITGLVAITPAAGVIAGWAAIVMGILSGSVPWLTMNLLGKKRPFVWVDDTLGVVHTHMIAGFLGGFFTGIFATIEGSAAFGITNPGGAIDRNGHQVWIQIVSALFVIAWNMAWTPLILLFIRFVLRIPLKFSDAVLAIGDDAIHGEAAYAYENLPFLERGAGGGHGAAADVAEDDKVNGKGAREVPSTTSAVVV